MRPDKKSGKDPRGGHIRLYWDLYDSNAWRCLGPTDQRAYLVLLRAKLSFNNGDLSLAASVARGIGIKSQTTLARSLRTLVAVGLVAVTRKGGCKPGGQRLPTLYRVTDEDCHEIPGKFVSACKASHEWKQVRTLAQGRALIEAAEKAAAAAQQTAKSKQVAGK